MATEKQVEAFKRAVVDLGSSSATRETIEWFMHAHDEASPRCLHLRTRTAQHERTTGQGSTGGETTSTVIYTECKDCGAKW